MVLTYGFAPPIVGAALSRQQPQILESTRINALVPVGGANLATPTMGAEAAAPQREATSLPYGLKRFWRKTFNKPLYYGSVGSPSWRPLQWEPRRLRRSYLPITATQKAPQCLLSGIAGRVHSNITQCPGRSWHRQPSGNRRYWHRPHSYPPCHRPWRHHRCCGRCSP